MLPCSTYPIVERLIQHTYGGRPKYNRPYSIRYSRFSKVPPGYGKGHES